MSRHLADKRAPTDGGRVKAFIDVERRQATEGAHPALEQLARREQTRGDGRRVQEYLRIERGHEA